MYSKITLTQANRSFSLENIEVQSFFKQTHYGEITCTHWKSKISIHTMSALSATNPLIFALALASLNIA